MIKSSKSATILSHRQKGKSIQYEVLLSDSKNPMYMDEFMLQSIDCNNILNEYKQKNNISKVQKSEKFLNKKRERSQEAENDENDRKKSLRSAYKTVNNEDKKSIMGILGEDKPLSIECVKRHKKNHSVICEIKWGKRDQGVQPLNSFYYIDYVKEVNPELVFDFYEKHLVLGKGLYE